MKVIWQSRDGWERDWLRELLGGAITSEIEDGDFRIVCDDAIVVVSHVKRLHATYYRQFREAHNAILVHVSDETYRDDYSAYCNFQYVLRNYWGSFFRDPRIVAIPLGYKQGFIKHSATPRAAARSYNWSFAGQVEKSTRREMVAAMSAIERGRLVTVGYFNDPSGLATPCYQNLLLDSIFVPCPMGFQNVDSFRIYEALECGCIPIVERRHSFDYFGHLLGRHPFISVTSWHDAPIEVGPLLAEPAHLEARRRECEEWWTDFKHRLSQRIAGICAAREQQSKVSRLFATPLMARMELLRHAPSVSAHIVRALTRRAIGMTGSQSYGET